MSFVGRCSPTVLNTNNTPERLTSKVKREIKIIQQMLYIKAISHFSFYPSSLYNKLCYLILSSSFCYLYCQTLPLSQNQILLLISIRLVVFLRRLPQWWKSLSTKSSSGWNFRFLKANLFLFYFQTVLCKLRHGGFFFQTLQIRKDVSFIFMDLGVSYRWGQLLKTETTADPGDRGSTVVKVLCYKSEGRWFGPSWCQWIFHWYKILPIALWSWGRLSL